jgi:hypothetical protein
MDFNNAGVHVSDFESDDLTNALTFYNELLLYSRGPMSLSAGGSLFYNNVKNGLFAEQASSKVFNSTTATSRQGIAYSPPSGSYIETAMALL